MKKLDLLELDLAVKPVRILKKSAPCDGNLVPLQTRERRCGDLSSELSSNKFWLCPIASDSVAGVPNGDRRSLATAAPPDIGENVELNILPSRSLSRIFALSAIAVAADRSYTLSAVQLPTVEVSGELEAEV